MKCPKCGYTSFDHLTACRKCDHDLAEFRARFRLGGRLPVVPEKESAKSIGNEESVSPPISESSEKSATEATDFGFDFLNEEDGNLSTESTVEKILNSNDPETGVSSASEESGKSLSEIQFDIRNEDSATAAGEDENEGNAAGNAALSSMSEEMAGLDSERFASEEDSRRAWDMETFAQQAAEEKTDVQWDSPGEETPEEEFSLETGEDNDPFPFEDEAKRGERDMFASLAGAEERKSERDRDTGAGLISDKTDSPGEGASEVDEDFAGMFLSSLDGPDRFEQQDSPEDPLFSIEQENKPASEQSPVLPFRSQDDDPAGYESRIPDEDEALEEFSPTAGEETESSESDISAAPVLRRIGAGVTDLVILLTGFGFFLLVGQLVQTQHGETLIPSAERILQLAIPYFLVLFGLFFGYFTIFHFLTGQTPGKMLFRVRVESSDGEHISFSQAFLRSVGGLFSLLIAGMGFAVVLLSRQRRGLNDLVAGSRVIFLRKESDSVEHAEEAG